VDDIKKLFERLTDLWHWLLGLVSGIIAVWKLCSIYGSRFWRAIALSDAIHDHLGPEASKQFVAEMREHKRDGVVRESRLQLVEKKLDLAVYLCSDTGSCEWVNNECAELIGLDRLDCLGLGWLEGVDAVERGKVYDVWMHAVSHRLPYEYKYTVHNRRTGKKIVCVTFAYPHITSDGKLLCYVGYLTPEK
jgi:PAS domain-containing protein